MRIICWLIATLLFCSSCEQSPSPAIDQVKEGLSSTWSKAGETLDRYTPNSDSVKRMTLDEVEKLFLYEYRVDDLPPDISAEKLQEFLASLGADRWDCFFLDRLTTELRVHCKRHPKSYLRYLLEFR
ncbi:MAG: hypothetical protein KDD62_08920 [Bdellovibrionales bacterium]|nr:hypothetical protein [Bdellovibrionales bacterium]